MSSKQQTAEKSKNVWETKKVEEAILKRAPASPPPASSPSLEKPTEEESVKEKIGVQRQKSIQTPREEARHAEEKERARRIKEEKKPDEVPIKKEYLEKIHKEILKREQVSPTASGEGTASFERVAAFSGKAEEHYDINNVHSLEEEERQRRMKEEKPPLETPNKSQLFKSLSKEICEKQKDFKAEVVEGVGSRTVDQEEKPDLTRSQQRSQADFIGTVVDEEEEKRRRSFDEDEKYRETLAHGFSEQAKRDLQKFASKAEACSVEGVGTGAKQKEVDRKISEEEKLMEPTAEEKSYQKYQYDKEHVKEQLEKEKLHDEAAIIGTVRDEGQELRRRLSHPDEEHKREELAHQLAASVKDQLAPKAARADSYSTSGVGTGSKIQEAEEKFGSELAQEEKRLGRTVEELKDLEQVNTNVFQTGPGMKESGVEIKEKIELATIGGKATEKVETTAVTPGGEETGLPNPKIVIKETGIKMKSTHNP